MTMADNHRKHLENKQNYMNQIGKSHTITAKTRRPLKNHKKTYWDHKKTTESTSGPHTNTEHTKDHTQLKKTHGDHKQLQEAHNHCNILFKGNTRNTLGLQTKSQKTGRLHTSSRNTWGLHTSLRNTWQPHTTNGITLIPESTSVKYCL